MAVTTSPGAGRVLIAVGGGPLTAEPSWTRFDNITACRCYGFDSYAGRQSELDTTDTGTATAYFHDQDRTLDDSALVGCQIMLQLYNPVTATWQIRWRGHIDRHPARTAGHPRSAAADTAIQCVGIFDYLGGVKFLPGEMGDVAGVAPAGMTGVVFYEDERVDDRIIALLDDAGIVSIDAGRVHGERGRERDAVRPRRRDSSSGQGRGGRGVAGGGELLRGQVR